MNNSDIPEHSDELWQSFAAEEARSSEELDTAYAEIEQYNATLLNQVAGIEDSGLSFVSSISGNLDGQDLPDLRNVTNTLLYLRPDTEQKLYEQGESPDTIHKEGEPYVINGPLPDRTKTMLDRMFAATNAVVDSEKSTPSLRILIGDVAGQPIRFEQSIKRRLEILPNKQTESTSTSIRVYRILEDKASLPDWSVSESIDFVDKSVQPRPSKLHKWMRIFKR